MAKLAAFNANSLSAVSDFFGEVEDEISEDERTHDMKKNGHVGVGSTTVRKSKTNMQLMSIGKHKKYNEEDREEEIFDYEPEEDGRTAITIDTLTKEQKMDANFGVKKKKKDKKKRRKEADTKAKKDYNSGLLHEREDKAKDEEIKEDCLDEGEKTANEEAPKKRQRIKKRSRQKNIRKDTRPAEARPAYLQLGSKKYTGRPLTDETLAILKMPKRMAKVKKNDKRAFQDFSNTKLAIEDLMKGSNRDFNKPTPVLHPKYSKGEKLHKKRRKPKYKNLI
mmetsp:Transcript_6312/g.9714  ORF Transcript_6312/g.9714 Transcript_6312/m.9714 type:complete len:279 (+) Transcript_6312:165-1001(+)|eukprot:CAMPEP_0178924726 /NCGR_PEP_ID=MMETSP0786-20121207/17489_1 /TAXON_ID=186022 /ORGANISM="Thalassionema frauenfeldii, Strain CCMP 1798" /LENGTH=278 /DNA_ID=CAMNT_0020599473 /DNA_START=56 /DNA_END=892 /DNA_ORIENTATION=-